MPRTCSAINCSNRDSKDNDLSFYRFPVKNKLMLQLWVNAVRRKNFSPTINHYICSKHFTADCFLPNYVNVRKLKENSVPTEFDFPSDLKKVTFKKKSRAIPRAVRTYSAKDREEENSLAVISTTSVDTERQVDEFNLSDNIHLVKLPNQWWTIHSFPNYVACARWNDAFVLDRRVVIKNDNSIKVSFNDIDLQTDEKVSSIQDVSFLLQKVDDYTACSNATNKFFFSLKFA